MWTKQVNFCYTSSRKPKSVYRYPTDFPEVEPADYEVRITEYGYQGHTIQETS